MIHQVTHTTTYSYQKPVSLCHNLVHVMPRQSLRQLCLYRELHITPVPTLIREHEDYFGNLAGYFTVEEPHTQLVVHALSRVEVDAAVPPEPARTPAWESVVQQVKAARSAQGLEAYQFVFDSPYIRANAELARFAAPSFPPGRPLLEATLDLMKRIHKEFSYDRTATMLNTPLHEVLEQRRGVCQDFAHLQIGCLRSLGLPARYVSGYLRTHPRPGQPRLVGADASHAWLSVWLPNHGWIDHDPTNGIIPSDEHIVLAWGRDYEDVSPVKGVNLGGGHHAVHVAVDVT